MNDTGNSSNYRDFSHAEDNNNCNVSKQSKTTTKQGVSASSSSSVYFPEKLHYMLSELEKDGQDNVVSWQPHGRCFVVHKQEKFVREILPLWFRQTKFESFQRQLNLYCFRRITKGVDKGGYYHEMFLRGKQFLAKNIERASANNNRSGSFSCASSCTNNKKTKKNMAARSTRVVPGSEPDFYSMSPLPAATSDGGFTTKQTTMHQHQLQQEPSQRQPQLKFGGQLEGECPPTRTIQHFFGRHSDHGKGVIVRNSNRSACRGRSEQHGSCETFEQQAPRVLPPSTIWQHQQQQQPDPLSSAELMLGRNRRNVAVATVDGTHPPHIQQHMPTTTKHAISSLPIEELALLILRRRQLLMRASLSSLCSASG